MQDGTASQNDLWLAFLLGAIPLITGCGIFLLWCATGWNFLQVLGMLNIVFGFFLFLMGSLCLIRYSIGVLVNRPVRWRKLILALAAAVVLLINFPTCAIIVDTVIRLERIFFNETLLDQSAIRIINASGSDIQSVDVIDLPFDNVGTIPFNEGRTIYFDETAADSIAIQRSASGELETIKLPLSNKQQLDLVVILLPNSEAKIVSLDPRGSMDFRD